jgi:hypothetical protein
MSEKTLEIINFIALILSIIIPVVSLLIASPEEIPPQTYIIFGIIVLVFIVGGVITHIISRWKGMTKEISNTKKEMDDIKKDLNFKELWNKMDVRLTILEKMFDKKNKRGQSIDPRIIIWMLLGVLLYFFLRSMGLFR